MANDILNLVRTRVFRPSDNSTDVRDTVAVQSHLLDMFSRFLTDPEKPILEFEVTQRLLPAVIEALDSSEIRNSYNVTQVSHDSTGRRFQASLKTLV